MIDGCRFWGCGSIEATRAATHESMPLTYMVEGQAAAGRGPHSRATQARPPHCGLGQQRRGRACQQQQRWGVLPGFGQKVAVRCRHQVVAVVCSRGILDRPRS